MEYNVFGYHVIVCMMDFIKEILILKFIIGFKMENEWRRKILAVLLVPVCLFLCVQIIPLNYVSISYFLIILMAVHLCVSMHNAARVLIAFISYVCICELDYFISAIVNIAGRPIYEAFNIRTVIAGFISLLILGIVSYFCNAFDISFYKKNYGNRKAFIVVEVGILFVNLTIMGVIFGLFSESEARSYGSIVLIAVMSLSLLLSVITLIFYCSVMNVREYKIMHQMNEERLRMQNEYYQYLRTLDTDTRKFRHDLQNHMMILHTHIRDGEYGQAEDYLQEITERLEQLHPAYHVGNGIMDAILNEKQQQCSNHNIAVKVTGTIGSNLTISSYDLCTIFANALDNAIEACERITEGKRYIEILVGETNYFLHILVKNSSNESNGKRTSKKNKSDHGFGLINIQETVDKNGGEVQIERKDKEFVIDILIKAFED